MDRRRKRVRVAAISVLLLAVTTAGYAVASIQSLGDDESVTGPEWKTTERRGAGAATAEVPARLTGVSVEGRERYDRVVFVFAGERPGYLVAYESPADPGGDSPLRITLSQTGSGQGRQLKPQLPAVGEIRQPPGTGGVVETVVTLAAQRGPEPVPFRVGLSVGKFYVDLAHPDQMP